MKKIFTYSLIYLHILHVGCQSFDSSTHTSIDSLDTSSSINVVLKDSTSMIFAKDTYRILNDTLYYTTKVNKENITIEEAKVPIDEIKYFKYEDSSPDWVNITWQTTALIIVIAAAYVGILYHPYAN